MYRLLTAARIWSKAALRHKIKYLILHVTSACNARCRMCFNWQGMQDRKHAPGPSLDNLARLAASMNPLPQLTCSGGEPLLRNDIPGILHAFYTKAGTRFFTVPTNARQPQRVAELLDAFVERCPKGFLNLCLPLHGPREIHEDIMGVPGIYDNLRETYAVVQERRKRHQNISCVLNFVMSHFNYKHYQATIDLALREFPETPLGIAYCRGATHEPEATDVPVDDYLSAQTYLAARRRMLGRYNPYTIMFSTIGEQMGHMVAGVVKGKCTNLRCGAGRNLAVVYDNGAVYPCELLETIGMPKARPGESEPPKPCLGNLNDFDYDMAKLLSGDQARQVVEWLDHHDCACTWECAIYSRILHSPPEMMRLGGRVVSYCLRRK